MAANGLFALIGIFTGNPTLILINGLVFAYMLYTYRH